MSIFMDSQTLHRIWDSWGGRDVKEVTRTNEDKKGVIGGSRNRKRDQTKGGKKLSPVAQKKRGNWAKEYRRLSDLFRDLRSSFQ